jgi:hypothetical protein
LSLCPFVLLSLCPFVPLSLFSLFPSVPLSLCPIVPLSLCPMSPGWDKEVITLLLFVPSEVTHSLTLSLTGVG